MSPWQSGFWYCWAAYFMDLVEGFLFVANSIDVTTGDLPADFLSREPVEPVLYDWSDTPDTIGWLS